MQRAGAAANRARHHARHRRRGDGADGGGEKLPGRHRARRNGFALAAIDVSTGEFLVTETLSAASLHEEIARLAPREIIAARGDEKLRAIVADLECSLTELDPAAFDNAVTRETLTRRFADDTGLAALDGGVGIAAGAALAYVEETFGRDLAHVIAPRAYRATEYMMVDEVTRRHLELISSSDGARRGSLLSVLDETLTAVGARTLCNWIIYPLLSLEMIRDRHDAVEELFEGDLGGRGADELKRIGDLERLAGRIGSLRASPRDCLRLADAIAGGRRVEGARSKIARARSSTRSRSGCDPSRSLRRASWRRSPRTRRSILATATSSRPG